MTDNMAGRLGRVVVGVSGSPVSLAALRLGVDQARRACVPLLAVHAWTPVHGELAARRTPCPPLLRLGRELAQQRLRTAFEEAFGELPGGVRVETLVVRAAAGPALVAAADRSDDLLVVGAGRRRPVGRLLHTSVVRHCTTRAGCPVLVVPASGLLRDWQRGRIAAVPPVVPSTGVGRRPATGWVTGSR